ncbi:MAG: plasmid pRiA4b ORF-3 family protein, partial [Actinobacteria bacterium]
RQPRCVAGERACPPEDVGGIGGHQGLAAWLRAGAPDDGLPDQFQDAEHARDWLPGDYDPDAFDADEATEAMRVWANGEHLPWHGLPEPLVDLITSMRSWGAVSDWLDALGPRQAQDLDDDDVQRAARPWRAVLEAVGPGVKLTTAGYLPPPTVEQIAQASGVSDWWIGKANREDLTPPVAELRESAQALGLLRKSKGVLMATHRARVAVDDPQALVGAVLSRLPLGKGFAAEAGWFALLGCAAGVSGPALYAGLAQILADRGWRTKGTTTVSVDQAGLGAEPTVVALEAMAGGYRNRDPRVVQRLARAALFGLASGR